MRDAIIIQKKIHFLYSVSILWSYLYKSFIYN